MKKIDFPNSIAHIDYSEINFHSILDKFSIIYVPYPFYCVEPIINIGYKGRTCKKIIQVLKNKGDRTYTDEYFSYIVMKGMVSALVLMRKGSTPIRYGDIVKFINGGFRI